jgi:hypothetical protein
MQKSLPDTELAVEARRAHTSLKWLLTLLSAVITTGLVVLLNHHV